MLVPAFADAAVRFKRAGAETLGGADVLAALPEACEEGGGRVWVDVDGKGECIAYHASSTLRGAKTAVLYFEGDIPVSLTTDPATLKQHLGTMMQTFVLLDRALHVPFVLVARPGTFGSTGDHRDRRKDREYLVMRAAVDALRIRSGLEAVSLAGQSGGATVVAGMLTLGIERVRCAVAASGGFDLGAMLDWHADRGGVVGKHRQYPASIAGMFNAMDRVAGIRKDARRRIFIVGDPADEVTPFPQQERFADRLRSDGHRAEVLRSKGSGPQRHGLALAALNVAGMCAKGAEDGSIRRAVQR